MKINIKNTYAGQFMELTLFGNNSGIYIQFVGFIETNSEKIQHAISNIKKINNPKIIIKIPNNILPSFSNKNFKIWYECQIFKYGIKIDSINFIIRNNNLYNYNLKEMYIFEYKNNYEQLYYWLKPLISKYLLNYESIKKFEIQEDTIVENKLIEIQEDTIVENKLIEFFEKKKSLNEEYNYEYLKAYEKILKSNMYFSNSNISFIKENQKIYKVIDGTTILAELYISEPFYQKSFLKILFFKNIKYLKIKLFELQYSNTALLNIEMFENLIFDVDGCIERIIEIKSSSYTVINTIFQIKHILEIIFDDVELSISLNILSDQTAIILIKD